MDRKIAGKKTTVNISEANCQKMQQVMADSGMSQTEYINKALAGVPILMLGNRASLAESFVELRILLKNSNLDKEKIGKEVNEICQYLNSLMEKIEDLQHSKNA